ncbi:MAG: AAA family ATPase [Actinomycetota bacterium]|nr:AAA family ATPase [Actinomycetota bacterium]
MSRDQITELRLTAFKSFANVVVPLRPLTLLIGRNGSGKSNALDALEVLSRLAKAEEVRDALGGNRRDAGPVRGGVEGCAPHGNDSFQIGVTVQTEAGSARLDLRIQVRPQVQIVWERLIAPFKGRTHVLLETQEPNPQRSDISAKVWTAGRGRNPHLTFRSSHLLTAQLPLRLSGKTEAERAILDVADEVLAVLSGVFHLDPVPHLMRQYVPEQDIVLRRTAENLSAAIARLKSEDRRRFADLLNIVKDLPEYKVRAIDIGKGGFGEVMLAIREGNGRGSVTVPARQMSDGMLRMLAIATALLTGGGGLAIEAAAARVTSAPTLVIEELENGLHPSQAARVLSFVKDACQERDLQVVLTTHSPALLDALSGDDHEGVLVIDRTLRTGSSRVRRLVDLPGYLRLMATDGLGAAATSGTLATAGYAQKMDPEGVRELLGIA